MKGVMGYVLAGLGLVLLALSFMNVAALEAIDGKIISGAGIVLVAVGVVMLYSGNKKHKSDGKKEVPIYEGSEVVGYRRE
jgi:uncharacterized membrane protein